MQRVGEHPLRSRPQIDEPPWLWFRAHRKEELALSDSRPLPHYADLCQTESRHTCHSHSSTSGGKIDS